MWFIAEPQSGLRIKRVGEPNWERGLARALPYLGPSQMGRDFGLGSGFRRDTKLGAPPMAHDEQ